ncbi:MAG TPA: peptidoglycan editing factor PgeF [Thermoclostridium caenicola]|uniref:peptidoglycan editing factor PgeF n=1 Tax=Thermoclostridium caenicola TaxID=659425 RepID=UPI002CD0FB33|nr:peptidoglycan editing factor PgeF [Thermoclostridium caenicola]HOK42550.1 peptidoglycan editing factor PgeF [Thermoclostridium caenicola]HOL84423.1 peptidoglycan editing factor PgeF [Thermoclostridium caenicola]HPO76589.1 peptidoglycan editing factor PgeF [Thermoclostridium caenicola]
MPDSEIHAQLLRIRIEKPRIIDIPGMKDFPELVQGFTTRYGGVSQGPYATLNLNFYREDDPARVMENFRLLSEEVGVSLENMVLSRQVHGCRVFRVDDTHRGMGVIRPRSYDEVDGLTTDIPGIMLVTYYADCVPLYFYDPVKKAICLSHSGWKGTLLDIAGESVKTMKNHYQSRPEDIRVSLGPHIRACCFEVGDDVARKFFDTFPWSEESAGKNDKGKWTLNLEAVIRGSLLRHGILEQHIFSCPFCTKCEHDVFFSHRGSVGKTGTGAALLMIRSSV